MAGLKIEIRPKQSNMPMAGQDQEKSEIAQIKEWATQISQACDILMQREEEEDQENQSEETQEAGIPDGASIEDKVNYIRNMKPRR